MTVALKEAARARKADLAQSRQRLAEIEARIAEIDNELHELNEADQAEMKAKGLDKPSSPPLCSLIVSAEDLAIKKGSPEWERASPARQRVIRRVQLKRNRQQLSAERQNARSRMIDRKRLAQVELTPGQIERLQERVNEAARDLDIDESFGQVFNLEDSRSLQRIRAVLRAGEELGITPHDGV